MKKHLVILEDGVVCNVSGHAVDGFPDYNLPDSHYAYWPIEKDQAKTYRSFIVEISKHLTTGELFQSISFDGDSLSANGVNITRQDEIIIE